MSGYTFIDNSELSVGEKIKKYFEKKQTASMDSSYSSTSSGSVDLDASFQKVLVARKLELTTRNQPVHAYLSDETIDLCSPPVGMSPTETIRTAIESNKNNRRKTVNLISFSDSSEDLEQVRDVITTHPKSYLIEDYSFNNSYNESWCKISDDTFERDEAMCASMLQDTDETQIIDVEAPSSLWEQSIFPMDDSVTKWKCVASGRRLPSTILEESTINSETSRESAQYQSDALTKNPTSNCVLLKPIVLPSNCAPKIKTISSSNSKLLENVQPTTSKSYYRPSMMNVFPLPGKKKRNFFFTDSPVLSEELLQSKSPRTPVHQLMSPIEQSPVVSIQTSNFKRKPLLTSPIQKIIPKPSAEPFELLTYPESSPASPFDDENISATSSNQLSPAQPEFNDTLEAVEFFMEKGKQLKASQFDHLAIQEYSTPPSPTAPLLLFSPKNNNKIPDTIRRRLLIRNFVSTANEATSPSGISNPLEPQRISDLQLMTRRSGNKSPNDSYWD